MTRLGLICVLALFGCEKRSDLFCQNNPDQCGDGGGGSDATGCDNCTAPLGVCNPQNNTCVQCLQRSDCGQADSPVCDQNVCRGCAAHSECPASNTCLPNGACADPADVAYVAAGGHDDAGNTKCDTPCLTISHALTSGKSIIKVTGVITDNPAFNSKAIIVVADPGSRLTASGGANIVSVGGDANTDVQIADLTIGGDGIINPPQLCISMATAGKLSLVRTAIAYCQAGGVQVSGGTLTVSRASIHENKLFGINMTAGADGFDITNTFVFHNGDNMNAPIGGVTLVAPSAAGNRFEFNTVVDNDTKAVSTAAGVNCDISGFHAANNIIARNAVALVTSAAANTFGLCVHDTSALLTDVTPLAFTQPGTTGHVSFPPYDYTLLAGSSAIDQGGSPEPTGFSPILIDRKGTTRPQMHGKDQGADEFKP